MLMSKDDQVARELSWQSARTVSERPWVSPSRATIFSSRDIWWLSVGLRVGQGASKSACFVVPPLFRADSGTNLMKQGEISKVGHWLNNCRLTDSKRPWV